MIDLEDAIKSAVRFSSELSGTLGDELGTIILPSKAPRLEGVEQDEVAKTWLITLSFVDEEKIGPFHAQLGFPPDSRTYRQFSVDGETGEIKSMRDVEL